MAEQKPVIGKATMKPDGTIELTLRAQTGRTIGDGKLVYTRDHPQYASVLKHLGGLLPGEEKPVLAWDE